MYPSNDKSLLFYGEDLWNVKELGSIEVSHKFRLCYLIKLIRQKQFT